MAYKKIDTNPEPTELILSIFKKSQKGFLQPSQIYNKLRYLKGKLDMP